MEVKHFWLILIAFLALTAALFVACGDNDDAESDDDEADDDDIDDDEIDDDEIDDDIDVDRPDGWGEDSHGDDADPDYDKVFPQGQVERIDITLTSDYWQDMLDDMTDNYGEFGAGSHGPPHPLADKAEVDTDPIWVPCTVEFSGLTWWHVGIRFKGNSTLMTSWSEGTYKLPLKLDIDEFEDTYPEIDDQRLYGFKRLALASNCKDESFLRQKIAGEMFREGGVPAPISAFYRVFIDHGDGPIYFGLYTMTEVPDKPMLNTYYGNDSGNLYKPEATWVLAENIGENKYPKKTNEEEADWSDIENVVAALHADRSDAAQWRTNFEALFEVDYFLNWLAINTAIQDWDTYGRMAHNYYLYSNPANDGKICWIPWDHNESFSAERQPLLPLDMSTVSASWPLIRFLFDDSVYQARYWDFLEAFAEGPFSYSSIATRLQDAHELIAPYVIGNEGEQEGYTTLSSQRAFEDSVDELLNHVQERLQAIE